MFSCREEIFSLTKRLVSIDSVVNTDGERAFARSLYEFISSFDYFQKNAEQVVMERTVNDAVERYNVLAYVKGTKKQSDRTVILVGHMDTVGVDDYNQLKRLAFLPNELMEEFEKEDLPSSVKEQLKSGNWLFGRGTLDMKSGVASHLYLLDYYSKHPEELEGNLVFVCECDEEDSSNGILSALKTLKRWKEEESFQYVAAINADYVAPLYEGDENRYIYKGTVGKLLPSFYVTGHESHVGAAFDGLDPNFLVAELTRQISYNPELTDEALGERTLPPVSLKQMDLKPSYTVQTALSAYVYYNFFIHSWSPDEVLDRLKEQATIAFENALSLYEDRYRKYCSISGHPYKEIPWKPRVMTYKEMRDTLIDLHGEKFTNFMKELEEELVADPELDTRMYAARIVDEAWKWMEDRSPAMILFYSSLYSPRIELSSDTEDEQVLLKSLDEAIDEMQPHYEYPIVTKNFFPYISDMSFLAMSDDEEGIEAVQDNNPSWGKKHYVDYQDIRDINVPIINIGPYGMDAHARLERVEMNYTFEIMPNLTNKVVKKVLNR